MKQVTIVVISAAILISSCTRTPTTHPTVTQVLSCTEVIHGWEGERPYCRVLLNNNVRTTVKAPVVVGDEVFITHGNQGFVRGAPF